MALERIACSEQDWSHGVATSHVVRCRLTAALIGALSLVIPASAYGQRPSAAHLLPESTLAMVRIADLPALVSRFRETAMGKMGQDARVQPLVSQVYQSVLVELQQVEQQLGLPVDQLLAIPQGEVCAALVGIPEQSPRLALLLDAKDQVPQARRALAKLEELLAQRGWTKESARIGQQEATVYVGGGPDSLYLVERDGTFVFTITRELMSQLVARWESEGERSLADSEKYRTIMTRCGASAPDPPQVTLYADPIELFRYAARGTAGVTALALIPTLGLDGLLGVGGSITFSSGEFDDVMHLHVLLDKPRAAVIDTLALSAGDSTPQAWVPGDCLSYSTIHWDLKHSFFTAARVYNSLLGEGQLENELRVRISEPLGADFLKEIMPELSGRGTWVQWVERPIALNSVTTMIGLDLKNQPHFQPTLQKIVQHHAARLEKQRFGENVYWLISGGNEGGANPAGANRRGGNRPERADFRRPTPCLGVVGDTLLFTDSLKAFQEAIATQNDSRRGLSSALEFKLIASKLRRQPGGEASGLLQFKRPEEALRMWYDLVNAEGTQKRLEERAEGNRLFRSLQQALRDNPLPPFESLAEYLAPGGGMLVSDASGFHYTSFTLKRK
jgi:Protein of unknown function (DUF3352)